MVQGTSTSTNAKEKSGPATKNADKHLECAGKVKRRGSFGSPSSEGSTEDPKRCRVALATALQIGRRPVITNVRPIAAANNPLSGRNKTASPPSSPATSHQRSGFFKLVLSFASSASSVVALSLKARVAARHIAITRNVVGTSVRMVAVYIVVNGQTAANARAAIAVARLRFSSGCQ